VNSGRAFLSRVGDFRARYVTGSHDSLIDDEEVKAFRAIIYDYYKQYRRDFPWRRTGDPYHILVSEVMLQQTQTDRVSEKFTEFVKAFPTLESLAGAEQGRVLAQWQGLGYNRRAVMLHRLAGQVMENYGGVIPDSPEELVLLPGIGKATAASICAFAFNRPVVFVETNIRTVFIHMFFPHGDGVEDGSIMPLVERTLDRENPHKWYSALMDFGVMLKKNVPNPGRRSRHHQKQSPFEGSTRQVRGMILKALIADQGLTARGIAKAVHAPVEMISRALADLVKEELIRKRGRRYYL